MNKRQFLQRSGAASVASLISPMAVASAASNALKPITEHAKPIAIAEYEQRIAKAQRLMAEQGIDALLIEPGSSMRYFSGLQWWRSERLTAVVIPQQGELFVVTPAFEEASVLESLIIGDTVLTWQEHDSPFALLAQALRARGLKRPRLGLEASTRWFVADGLRRSIPNGSLHDAAPVVDGCRVIKTKAERSLMRLANQITLAAYAHVWPRIKIGMTGAEIKALMSQAQAALGGSRPWQLALVGPASAYPHGTREVYRVEPGSVVLMDCGCAVEGYQSDISRTFVVGEPSAKIERVWNTARAGQQVAMTKARPGTPAGQVDDAVRAYYASEGYGPDYALPGLSHRLGHGIGMDGHEPINFVRGETTKLAPGMCLSNEPGIYLPGEFGVRTEDCIHIGEAGPIWFTTPPTSLAEPLGGMGPAIV